MEENKNNQPTENLLMGIPPQAADALMEYLGTRPYKEVFEFMEVLRNLTPIRLISQPQGSEENVSETK